MIASERVLGNMNIFNKLKRLLYLSIKIWINMNKYGKKCNDTITYIRRDKTYFEKLWKYHATNIFSVSDYFFLKIKCVAYRRALLLSAKITNLFLNSFINKNSFKNLYKAYNINYIYILLNYIIYLIQHNKTVLNIII